uniref:Uncharacterized protein n=1 Tax=Ditylenchus dipsaci TaxID=166011 RepID=A0A915CMD5_9BILA
MYFEQPDAAGHREGPESDLVNSALIYVDAMINYLMYRLDKKGYLGCINIVLLSDHGSQKLREDHFIAVENYLDINDTNLEIFTGAIGQLTFKNKSDVNMAAKIAPFACQEGHTFRVYTKDIMPKRYHYGSNNRIGDIVLDASAGTRIFKTNEELRACDDKGDHGYDNRIKEMRAIFGAYGPSLKENFHIPPFQNIELYNLFTDLMQFPYTADNNGTRGVLYPILKKAPDYEPTQTVELNACEDLDMIKCGDGCHFELNYGENVKQKQSSCIAQSVQVPQDMDHSSKPCLVKLCNSSLVYSKRFAMAMMVESILADPVPNIDHRANCTAHLKFEKTKIEETTTSTASTTSTTTSMPTSSETSTTEPSKNIDEKDVQPSNQETPLPADFS